jgi:hypothetical protein
MKKITLTILLLAIATISTKAQIGINTATPQATLDITAKNGTAPDGLLVPRVDRLRAQNMAGVQNSTLIFVNSVSNGTQTGQAINIDAAGYYYFNTPTSAWVKLNPTVGPQSSVNIYNSNGTLNSARTVDQGGFSLAFTNTNLTNAFSVDGNTFSVDALNNRIGIGTVAPVSNTHIINNGTATTIGSGVATNTALILENPTAGRSVLAAMKASNATTGAKEIWFGINPNYNNNKGSFDITRNVGQADFTLDLSSGNIGINTSNPTNKLHVAASDPLRLEGVNPGNASTDKLLSIDGNGVVKSIPSISGLSIPAPAVFTLNTTMYNFLGNLGDGKKQNVPMVIMKNAIPGLTYDTSTNTVSFAPGTYQMTFVYEADHNAPGCTLSSYFVDFPGADYSIIRIHNTAAHSQGPASNHGGSLTYTFTTNNNYIFPIQLGRGQSGNCYGNGMTLKEKSTHLLIYRLGD